MGVDLSATADRGSLFQRGERLASGRAHDVATLTSSNLNNIEIID